MKTIYFCAGHGKHTPGKRSPSGKFEEREWFFNNEVALAFEKQMKLYEGVSLHRTDDRTGERDVPLAERTNKANRAGADIYISFHHNAYQSKWGNHTGVETFYHAGSTKGKALAQAVHPSVVKAYGLKDRGLKTNNLHITRETKMPAILIEGGFMDSTIDIERLRDKSILCNAGKMIADAVAKHLGLKKKSENSSPAVKSPSQPNKPASPKPSKPESASLTVDGKWGSDTTRALQKALGTTVDGIISNQPRNDVTNALYGGITWGSQGSPMIRALQRKVGAKADGKLGPETIRKLQKYLGTPVDGVISRPSSTMVKELQRRLNKGNF
ncbi:N-acetylmuramoyl-L-alanine amidase [Pueribacillus theae]|nr:N-acetylmuramoyl-L-alanine amidase [Pueribacillus theae]